MGFKKVFISTTVLILMIMLFGVQTSFAAQTKQDYLIDNFDSGISEDTWEIVNDENETIQIEEQAGNLRYIAEGGEEAIVTKDPLTSGEGVTGYSVQFDFHYQSDNWEHWYAFAFNKVSATNGLDWGKGGYLLGRTGSLQVNNPNDSSSTGEALDILEVLTPDIPSVSFKNITFKFVYDNADKTLDMYYDLAGDNPDLTTIRATYTFNSLDANEDYHFAIITSSAGFVFIDNMIIHQTTADGDVEYLNETFETNELPEKIVLMTPELYSYGPAKSLKIVDSSIDTRIITKESFRPDSRVFEPLTIQFDLMITNTLDQNKLGFVYGLESLESEALDEGVTYVFFRNVLVEGVETTYISASVADGEVLVNKADHDLGINLALLDDYVNVGLKFNSYGQTEVSINGEVKITFEGNENIGHFGFFGEAGNTYLIDNFEAIESVFDNQSYSRPLHNNFNTGYVNKNDFEIFNYIDKRPGSEVPLFTSTQGIHVADGKLHFDVASESSAIYTIPSFNDFELRFDISNFGIPRTPMNEDGEIDGVEIPETFYVAIGMGYESNVENFWNVRGIYFQDRFGNATIETMNIPGGTSTALTQKLRMGTEENIGETFHFKVVALEGTVKFWVRRGSDPISIFDGEPLATYTNVDTKGRIGISTSALGSYSLDNLSIVPIGENLVPVIEDSRPPADFVAPVITVVDGLPMMFEVGGEKVDFKQYFKITDEKDGEIEVTGDMLNLGGFNINYVGPYRIILTVTDSDGNQSQRVIAVAVTEKMPEVVEQPAQSNNTALIATIASAVSLIVGAGATFLIVTKIKK